MQSPCRLGYWCRVCKPCLHQGSVFLRPHPQVLDPLVKPGGLERSRGHFSDRACSVWPAKGGESFFRPRADIRVARVRRCAYPRQDEKGSKVSLIEHIRAGIRGEVPTVPDETEMWV